MLSSEERSQLIADIAIAIKASQSNELSDEERQWVRLAIEAEARKIRFRDAVIEKSLASLVWLGITGIGYLIVDILRSHGLHI